MAMEFDPHKERTRAVAATGVILFIFALWLGLEAPRGTLWGTDDLLTAERTREMLVTGEYGVVHYNFHRSFEKPPLQYWLTCLTLPRFQNRALAVRIWPLVYGVCTAIALAWLVFLIKPDRPCLIPLTIGLLVSGPLFSTESSRGMLDIGLTFYTTLVFVFAELARKKPAWWLAVAGACWLGSLQKVPVPFLVWMLIILVRLMNRDERARLRTGAGWLVGSVLLAIAAMSIWPLLQVLKYGMQPGVLFQDEVVDWLGPEGLGQFPYFRIIIAMCLHPGGVCGFLSLIALFVTLFSRKERTPLPAREIALVTLIFLILTIVSNFRDIRYVLPVFPGLCLLLALGFFRFLNKPPVRTRAIVVLIIVLGAGFIHAEIHINHRRRYLEDEKVTAEKLGELQKPGTTTILVKAVNVGNDLLYASFYLFHGNFRFPVTKMTKEEIRANPPKPPLVGAAVARDFPVVQELYPNVLVRFTRAQFICWEVTATPSSSALNQPAKNGDGPSTEK